MVNQFKKRTSQHILRMHFNWIKKYRPKSKYLFLKKKYLFIIKMKSVANILEKKIQRQQAIIDGAYDGRYRKKVIPNKKKQLAKEWARRNNGT